MSRELLISCLLFLAISRYRCVEIPEDNETLKWPTIVISVLVRNKAHTLPYFLTCINNLDYPKSRLKLWIHSDHNEDDSIEILEKWLYSFGSYYHAVNLTTESNKRILHPDESKSTHWSSTHFKHVISLREKALNFARDVWADYLFMVDADVFLTYKLTLKDLVSKHVDIVAPMLVSDGVYSNFWCGMTDSYYYKRTDEYKEILQWEKEGCFEVPMVHTAVLINMRLKDYLSYDPKKIAKYDGPQDDIIAFALSAKRSGIKMHVCNDKLYGFVTVPLEDEANLEDDYEQLLNVKLEAIVSRSPLPADPVFKKDLKIPAKWKYGVDMIYMINLERRKERRDVMTQCFDELGMDVKVVNAVDGRKIDLNELHKLKITLMPNYEDPFHKRPMKSGEVGCFLSHYYIWQDVKENGYHSALILEDDIHFVPYFRHKLLKLIKTVKDFAWNFVYIGRKIMAEKDEKLVADNLVRPEYSYWTLGYLINDQGANKLLNADPLEKMLPVDEFLPIMFDQHPNETWKNHFPKRNLIAFSASPLLVHPTHYIGQDGYISDTEDSNIVHESTSNVKHEL